MSMNWHTPTPDELEELYAKKKVHPIWPLTGVVIVGLSGYLVVKCAVWFAHWVWRWL